MIQTQTDINQTNQMESDTLDSQTLAHQIVDIIENKQASDILLLDVTEQTSIASYFVIATIDNERQARAIEGDLFEQLRVQQNVRPLHMQGIGDNSGGWALLDYGDVIVHLLTEERRQYYDLEELWSKANVVLKLF